MVPTTRVLLVGACTVATVADSPRPSGWENLHALTLPAGVHVPAGFESLFPSLVQHSNWVWGTDVFDPIKQYMFQGWRAWLEEDRSERFRFCHAGHGMNSYALTLEVVTDRVCVSVQEGWGGVYTDQVAASRRVSVRLRQAFDLVTLAAARTSWPAGMTLLVAVSDMRRVGLTHLFGPEPVPFDLVKEWGPGLEMHDGEAFGRAAAWVSGDPAALSDPSWEAP